MHQLRILIADQQPMLRQGFRQVVEANDRWSVVGETGSCDEAVSLAAANSADIAVVSLSLPGDGGIAVTRKIVETGIPTRVLLYGGHAKADQIAAGMAAGASGYVLDCETASDVRDAIASLGRRQPYLSSRTRSLLDGLCGADGMDAPETFTRRERQVVEMIAAGQSNRQIAETLGKSVKTIESHRTAAMRKAGVNCVAQLVVFAIKHNLIEI